MAFMAMMPLIARLVWLLTLKRSADSLKDSFVWRLNEQIGQESVLVSRKECCVGEILRPSFQERVLYKFPVSCLGQTK
jgi:hypothetical protein